MSLIQIDNIVVQTNAILYVYEGSNSDGDAMACIGFANGRRLRTHVSVNEIMTAITKATDTPTLQELPR